jgi:hypothetical protein
MVEVEQNHSRERDAMKSKQSYFVQSVAAIFLFCQFPLAGWEQTPMLSTASIGCIAAFGDTLFAVRKDTSCLYLSTDNGLTWAVRNNGFDSSAGANSFARCGGAIFAATWEGLYKSNDAGKTWTKAMNGIMDTVFWSLAVSGNTIYAGAYPGAVYVSSDTGASWVKIGFGKPATTNIQSVAAQGSNIVAGVSMDGIYCSNDNGASWKKTLNNDWVLSLAASETTFFATVDGSVYRSANNNFNWAKAGSDISGAKPILASNGKIFVAGDDIYVSSDNGITWAVAAPGLIKGGYEGLGYEALAANRSYLFAGGHKEGIWRVSLSQLSVEKQQHRSSTPTAFTLTARGEINSNVLVGFYLGRSQHVSLKLYTLSGAEIISFLNTSLGEGFHRISCSTRSIPPGCYIMRMQSTSGVYSRIFSKVEKHP